jgi:hypothetical protein
VRANDAVVTRSPRTPVLALLLATAALAAGCSSTPTVDRSKLEDEISSQLEKQVGQAPDKIECPGDLTGEVGETERCTLTAGSDQLGVSVKVTAVDGEKVDFDIEVDKK